MIILRSILKGVFRFMPAKNRIKSYSSNGYYHIYNRGVEKREIFTDRMDEKVFLSYLKNYLVPKDTPRLLACLSSADSNTFDKSEAIRQIRMNNFSDEIDLLAYCLMPNHFHFLIKQNSDRSIAGFMKSLSTRYVQYFNKSHGKRVGGLFQDSYKAVLVESEEQLIYLTRYIHRNPNSKGRSLKDCPVPSSYLNYLGIIHQDWVKPELVLGLFAKEGANSYEAFV